jgi:hypothetical protein
VALISFSLVFVVLIGRLADLTTSYEVRPPHWAPILRRLKMGRLWRASSVKFYHG